MGVGPDPKLLPVVSKDGHRTITTSGHLSEVVEGGLRTVEGNHIAEAFADRQHRQCVSVTLRQPGAVELFLW